MSRLTKAPAGTTAHPVSTPLPPALEILSTYLAPADPFPSAPAELELVELLVLHSRITRQLDREYRTDPAGAHPVTLDRAQELVVELDTRQAFLAPTGATPRQAGKPSDDPPRARKKALSDQTLREPETRIQDLDRLRSGEQIEVWHHGQKQCVGTVDETAPSLGVVWIREALDGYRRMVPTQDTELRRHIRPLSKGVAAGLRPGAASATFPACAQQEETS